MNQKRCTRCDVLKPLEAFHAQAAGKYGRTARCIECVHADTKLFRETSLSPSLKAARVRKEELRRQGLKECSGCKEVKVITDFWLVNSKPNSRCKICQNAAHKEWKANNPQHMLEYVREYTNRPEIADRKSIARKQRRLESPRWVMQITLRHGLKRFQTENPATIDDLMRKWHEQDGRCAVSGIEMTWGKGVVLPTSISLDRIDPNQGYNDANLRLICHAVNAFKGRMSDAEMLEMARAIIRQADLALLTTDDDRDWHPPLRLVS